MPLRDLIHKNVNLADENTQLRFQKSFVQGAHRAFHRYNIRTQ